MNPNNDLTVVFSIKDRAPYTLRWMTYANRISFPFKVIIADGGKDASVPEELKKPVNFPNVNYEYIQYPYDETYSCYYAKLANALSRVDTPFATIVDDACFYIINGLKRSVEFLYSHPNYSVCGGGIGTFSVWPDNNKSPLNPAFGDGVHFFSNMYRLRQLEDETAGARIARHFAQYRPTWYDVHRTEQLRACFNILREINFKDYMMAELLTSFLTVCAGKVKNEPYLYMMRQIKNRGSSAGEHIQKWGDTFDRMLLESWSEDFTKFVYSIAAAIADKDKIPLDDARLQVKKGYRMYVAPGIIELLSSQNAEVKQSLIINEMKKLVRKLEYDGLARRFLDNLWSILNNRSKRNLSFPIRKSSEFYGDIKPLQDFLTSNVTANVTAIS
jgi:glycosyltransferase domain-containing protein